MIFWGFVGKLRLPSSVKGRIKYEVERLKCDTQIICEHAQTFLANMGVGSGEQGGRGFSNMVQI